MTTKLIALAIIAAGVIAADSKEIAVGQSFEAPDDLADKLIAEGQAQPDQAPPAAGKAKPVKVRVLLDCSLGSANDVIEVASDQVKALEAQGQIDSSKAAVTYALTLKAEG